MCLQKIQNVHDPNGQDAYYCIPIRETDTKLLKFFFDGKLYKFNALPNGYTEGPRKFTKAVKPILAKLRKLGTTICAYIDDFLIICMNKQTCLEYTIKAISLFEKLGFTINHEKSIFLPAQVLTFLGFDLNTKNMTIQLTYSKMIKTVSFCNNILISTYPSIRDIAILLGLFSSSFVSTPFGKLHYRDLERCTISALRMSKGNFDEPILLDSKSKDNIIWWRDNIMSSHAPVIRENPSVTINTDACLSGWGGAIEHGQSTGGIFTQWESLNHINVLETIAVKLSLKALCSGIKNAHILIKSDNSTTVTAISKMGSTKSLVIDNEIHNIWNWAITNNNFIYSTHIPGVLNETADKESRKAETRSEWMLNKNDFTFITNSLNFHPSIDIFASRLNTQLKTFFSFRPDPECSAVDAFSENWGNIKLYAFPPFSIIGKTLQKIENDKATGIMVVPEWPNQPWYSQFQSIVKNYISLPPRSDLLILPSTPSASHPLCQHLRLQAAVVSARP